MKSRAAFLSGLAVGMALSLLPAVWLANYWQPRHTQSRQIIHAPIEKQ